MSYAFTEQKVVFDAIRELMTPPAHTRKGKIGFTREKEQ